MTSKKLLTVAEVAEWLSCKPDRVYDWVAAKRLRGTKVGNLLRFEPADVEAFLASGKTT